MTREEIVKDCVHNRNRLEVTPKDYLKKFNNKLWVIFIFSLLLAGSFIAVRGISFEAIAISGGFVFLVTVILYYIRKKTNAVALKGDTIILKDMKDKTCVTSVRSVREITTNSVFGIQWTTLKYKLDGIKRSTFFVNLKWTVSDTPEEVVRKAIDLSSKKKANHKLGSVSNLAG